MVRPKKVKEIKCHGPTASEQRRWARKKETLEKFDRMRRQEMLRNEY